MEPQTVQAGAKDGSPPSQGVASQEGPDGGAIGDVAKTTASLVCFDVVGGPGGSPRRLFAPRALLVSHLPVLAGLLDADPAVELLTVDEQPAAITRLLWLAETLHVNSPTGAAANDALIAPVDLTMTLPVAVRMGACAVVAAIVGRVRRAPTLEGVVAVNRWVDDGSGGSGGASFDWSSEAGTLLGTSMLRCSWDDPKMEYTKFRKSGTMRYHHDLRGGSGGSNIARKHLHTFDWSVLDGVPMRRRTLTALLKTAWMEGVCGLMHGTL